MSDIKEYWRDIEDEPNFQISSTGRIHSKTRMVNSKYRSFKQVNGQFIKASKRPNGYMALNLNGRNRYVHRLVAEAFLDRPSDFSDGFYQPDHIDFDRTNNNVTNLQWLVCADNIQRSVDAGRMNQGIHNSGNKLTEDQVREIKTMLRDKVVFRVICKQFSVSKSLLDKIQAKILWRHIII